MINKNYMLILISLIIIVIILTPFNVHDNNKNDNTNSNYNNRSSWKKFQREQILGNAFTGSLFDPSVLIDNENYKMYVSSRKDGSIVLYTSKNGVDFDQNYKVIIQSNNPAKYVYNRPSILKHDGLYYLYYTKQWDNEYSEIYVAKSNDGIHFEHQEHPVLTANLDFEGTSVMNPNVIYDNLKKEFKMYYVAGEFFEPDYICLAHSNDGITWTKNTKPILQKNSNLNSYDYFKVGATDVHIVDNVYYMFYIGYTDIHTGRILFTTSNDGVNFNRGNTELIAEADSEDFDKDSVYKPSAVFNKKDSTWYLYYNGRTESDEYIGLYTKKGYKIK